MKNIILSIIFLIVVFVISEFIFEPAHLYYELKWLDIPMHILGGFGLAALISSIYSFNGVRVPFFNFFVFCLAGIIFLEVFQYAHDLSYGRSWNGIVDSASDIINGIIGVMGFYYLVKK